MPEDKDDTETIAATTHAQQVRRGSASDRSIETTAGIEHIREILFGDIVAEIERRLARLDHLITHRNGEVQQAVRSRVEMLEGHVRKELEGMGTRAAHDNSELSAAIRALRSEHRSETAQLEQRLARIEDRIEASVARVEREAREQVLAQGKAFIEEIERVRDQLRAALASELGLSAEPLDQEAEHAGTWPAPH